MTHVDTRIPLTSCSVDTLRLGAYEFEPDRSRTVGRGGTCLVYHALQKDGMGLGRRVILKEFYPDCPEGHLWRDGISGLLTLPQEETVEDRKSRFIRSYELFKALFNEEELNLYTVQAQNCLEGNGTVYMVVDYGSGMTLREYMGENPGLYDFLTRIRVLMGALEKLHSKGFVHMDLKPENLLCYREHDVVKLLDTDSLLEKHIFTGKPRRIEISGTRGYMAPEVLELVEGLEEDWLGCYDQRHQFAELGHLADLYCVGVMLRRFLQEGCPRDASVETCLRQREPYLSGKAVWLTERLLEKMLARRPRDRYASMGHAARDLEELLTILDPKKPRLAERFAEDPFPILGREELLQRMETLFESQPNRGSRILCLSGIGGVGKSALARSYARQQGRFYDVIAEVSASSARDAVTRIGILNWEPDSALSDGQCWESCKKMLIRLCAEQKTLLIVHDYDVSADPDFIIWRELGCDVILTGRYDWTGSGIPTVRLRCADLDEERAKQIFAQYYLHGSESREQERRRRDVLKSEDPALTELVQRLDNHPLTLKLLARYMTGVPGQELGPEQALAELTEKIFRERSPVEFQNDRDDAVRADNVYGHLAGLFRYALDSNRFCEEEVTALRNMILIPSGYGISAGRFEKWSGIEAVWLERLRRKGWLECRIQKQDVLADTPAEGVYVMPRALQQVLVKERELVISAADAGHYTDRLYLRYREEETFIRRQTILAHMEQALILPELDGEIRLWLLLQLAEIYSTLTMLDRLADTSEQVLNLYKKMPEEVRKDPDLRAAVGEIRRMDLLLRGSWKDSSELSGDGGEKFDSLAELAREIHCRFEYGKHNEAMALIKKICIREWDDAPLQDWVAYRAVMTQAAQKTGFRKLADENWQKLLELCRQEQSQMHDGSVDPIFFGAACDYLGGRLDDGCPDEMLELLHRLHDGARDALGPENMFAGKLADLLADAYVIREEKETAARYREQALAGAALPLERATWLLQLALDYRDMKSDRETDAREQALEHYRELTGGHMSCLQPAELAAFYYAWAADAVEAGMVPGGLGLLEQWLRLVRRLALSREDTASHFAAVSEVFRAFGLKEKATQYRPRSIFLRRRIAGETQAEYRRLLQLAQRYQFRRPLW